ncbi:DUF4352 domain-containing protein [Allobranchiibius sp. GilTou73]|uniref:DUF4352 domain-containing protein n=1 Tax=Allobranchiibius sp. GilTou73 TaxID=2904523 RepID=UPI001F21980C|nr:DUF4352 domain-containing protein [Allobranchiibius sp. GilTou73]UIJ33507.1 DUF4352 domain-containing protein [Allobranchiibius sp. GilTou73]
MTYLLTRRGGRGVRLAVVASAIGSVGVLTGCGAGTDAPTVVTPSRDVVTSAPPVTALPSTSDTGVGTCGAYLGFGPTPGGSTRSHRFGTTAPVDDADTGAGSDVVKLSVTVRAPRVVSAVAEDAPKDGYQYVAVDLSVTLNSGDSTYIGSIDSFSVLDRQGNRCDYREDTGAIPAAQEWKDGDLSATKKTRKGSMVFQVPIAVDVSSLTVAFLRGLGDTATDRWID